MAGGVGDQKTAVGQHERLAGEAQMRGDRLGRDIRPVTAPERALGGVLRLQLLDELLNGVRMPLARVLGDDIALGIDDDEGGPGPYGVLLPGGELGVVEHGVMHLIALDGVDDGLVLGLVHELRRMDPDDHHGVAVLLLELAQFVQDMQTVNAAKCPKIEDNDASSQVSEGVLGVARIEPAAPADELGGPNACTCSHTPIQPHETGYAFQP